MPIDVFALHILVDGSAVGHECRYFLDKEQNRSICRFFLATKMVYRGLFQMNFVWN